MSVRMKNIMGIFDDQPLLLEKQARKRRLPAMFGRSMVEMIGVLSIVGLLSVGALSGYSKAMTTWKYIKAASELSLFLNELWPYRDELYASISYNTSVKKNEYHFAELVPKMGIMPPDWTQSGIYLYDRLGGRIKPFARDDSNNASGNRLSFDYTYKYSNETDIRQDYCLNILDKIILPYQDIIQNVHTNVGGSKNDYYYGQTTCKEQAKSACIKDMTRAQKMTFCNRCKSNKECTIVFDLET
jgi:type II secretory pathway pseudopilin PulG